MGKKYLVDALFADASHCLTSEYPSTLAELDTGGMQGSFFEHSADVEVDVINVASEVGLRSVLPLAFYYCSLPIQNVFSGVRRDDGTLAILSTENQRRLIIGRDTLFQERHLTIYSWLEKCNEVCEGEAATSHCGLGRYIFLSGHLKQELRLPGLFKKWDSSWERFFCGPCTARGKPAHKEGRIALWERLPGIFGFSSWQTLRDSTQNGV
jgi:hypothetical protein